MLITRWADELRDRDINLPVHVGVVGPATLTTLMKYAAACGVGNSISFLRKRGGAISSLTKKQSPEAIVSQIEKAASMAGSQVAQLHIYPFGGGHEFGRLVAGTRVLGNVLTQWSVTNRDVQPRFVWCAGTDASHRDGVSRAERDQIKALERTAQLIGCAVEMPFHGSSLQPFWQLTGHRSHNDDKDRPQCLSGQNAQRQD